MDILAHGLWAGLGVRWLARKPPPSRTVAVATIALAVLPDIVHLLPIMAWALFDGGSLAGVLSYAVAVPGQEQALPAWAALWSHHLHCTLHSAVIAGAATLLLWRWRRTVGLPLAGWWSHIVIDVFTHSAEFYPVSVLYPLTYRGFDGLAWNTPWFMVANYLALAACYFALRRRQRSADADS
jgi:hypothetical protein